MIIIIENDIGFGGNIHLLYLFLLLWAASMREICKYPATKRAYATHKIFFFSLKILLKQNL